MFRSHVLLTSSVPSAHAHGYRVAPSYALLCEWAIVDGDNRTVDIMRVRAVAEYMAEKLNAGKATINPHACVGCRVEVF